MRRRHWGGNPRNLTYAAEEVSVTQLYNVLNPVLGDGRSGTTQKASDTAPA